MAQTISLPMRFRFIKVPAIWEIRPTQGRGRPLREFAFSKLPTIPSGELLSLPELDGWRCRDEFMGMVEGDNAALLRFLDTVGVWSNSELAGHRIPAVAKHCREGHPTPLDVAGMWGFRADLKRALMDRKRFKELYAPRLPRIKNELDFISERGIEFPLQFELADSASGVLTTTDAYHMLMATVFADTVRGIRFKICARKDCAKPFAIESRHARKFCCQYCGHLVSQRKKRAREKKESRKNPAVR